MSPVKAQHGKGVVRRTSRPRPEVGECYWLGTELPGGARAYFNREWNQRRWWLRYRHDGRAGWIRADVRQLVVGIMPTTYRTLHQARLDLRGVCAAYTFDVHVYDARTHERVDEKVSA